MKTQEHNQRADVEPESMEQIAVMIVEDLDSTYVLRLDTDADDIAFGRGKPLFVAPWDLTDHTNKSYLACERWINEQPNLHFRNCASLPNSEAGKGLGKYVGKQFVACYCDCKSEAGQ